MHAFVLILSLITSAFADMQICADRKTGETRPCSDGKATGTGGGTAGERSDNYNDRHYGNSNTNKGKKWPRETLSNGRIKENIQQHEASLNIIYQTFPFPQVISTYVDKMMEHYIAHEAEAERYLKDLERREGTQTREFNRRKYLFNLGHELRIQARDDLYNRDVESFQIKTEIAVTLFDFVTGTAPVVSWARDLYEAILGEDFVSGETLSAIERAIAIGGVVTGGFFSKAPKILKVLEKLVKGEKAAESIKASERLIESAKKLEWKAVPEVFSDLSESLTSISKYGRLPDKYISKDQARLLGWDPKKGNLNEVAPGRLIGGDVFKNRNGKLPLDKSYNEADLGYRSGFRGKERIVYSQDGKKIYVTNDHYETFTEMN